MENPMENPMKNPMKNPTLIGAENVNC